MSQELLREFVELLERTRSEAEAKLPPEDRPANGKMPCAMFDDGYFCTKARNHAGDHVAHGRMGEVLHRWRRS